ncbi:multi-sensor signal transduction histidine kinase [Methanoculleus bourgensis MS2]|uniref:Multi-sensor signal transduction histidine kinase n=1 Tax=Methanoculleus bourgensis (strain ATCC 43281 / DSM 3045 / OCM 15 / MS2) TaxID=1201294 RepID=I7KZ83_METBM|nr:HAMP domain-containing sensor histidine kinase [Methanoculleus bourgensis]CCJ36145.1 multi-sensor signal transduction histidine kinase [Methanoculleus bourgensis MS2]
MTGKFGVLYCENLAREMAAVVATGEFLEILTEPFRMDCGGRRAGWDRFVIGHSRFQESCEKVCVLGCGCLKWIEPPGPAVVIPDLMREVLLPVPLYDACVREGAFMVIPGMLSRWSEYLAGLGFEGEAAGEFCRESIRKIVLLDTGIDPEASRNLAALGDDLGIPIERIPVGIEPLQRYLALQYLQWRLEQEKKTYRDSIAAANQRSADYAMTIDILGRITELQSEETVAEEMLDLVTVLFAPARIGFASIDGGEAGRIISRPPGYYDAPGRAAEFFAPETRNAILSDRDGLSMEVRHKNQCVGVLVLEGLAVPHRAAEYLSISRSVTEVCGLAIANARTYQKLQEAVMERDREIGERMRAEKALREANRKLNTLSSITRHDILNQLAALLGYLEITQMDLESGRLPADPTLVRYVANELQAARTIQRQVEFTRFYQDIGVKEAEWHDAETLIRQAAEELPLSEVRVDIGVTGLWVYADPLIGKVFYNLMENSVRHGGDISRISFLGSRAEGGLVITYTDDGRGIPAADKERIFRKGFGKNTGLGLFLTREILAITGITINETGVEGEGVRFEIFIPEGEYRLVGSDT